MVRLPVVRLLDGAARARTAFAMRLGREGLYRWWFIRPGGELFTLEPGVDRHPRIAEFDPAGGQFVRNDLQRFQFLEAGKEWLGFPLDGGRVSPDPKGWPVAGQRDGRRHAAVTYQVTEVMPDGRVVWRAFGDRGRLVPQTLCPLVRFGSRGEPQDLDSRRAVLRALDDDRVWVRRRAVGFIGSGLMPAEGESAEKARLRVPLGDYGDLKQPLDRETLGALLHRLRDPSPEVRCDVLELLSLS